jgi:dienelactone hydrolase
MRHAASATLGALLLAMIANHCVAAAPRMPGPQGPRDGPTRREPWFIPLPGERLLMHATVMRPPGAGPFPLAVINHGSSQSSYLRATATASDYPYVSQWFLDRGFAVVLPLRPGHGETGGPYFEDQGRCENADYRKAGLATADSIQAAIDYLTAQPFVRKSGVVVAGQSAGGWGALALASRNPPMVTAAINFAGGRGGRADDLPNHNCVPERLIAAAGEFGRTARVPTLWLYARNDSYFPPSLSKQMHQSFAAAGGTAEFHLLPALGAEGHMLTQSADTASLWRPIVEGFLARLHD